MRRRRRLYSGIAGLACILALACRAGATGVPIGGFLPLVGLGLSNQFRDDLDTFAYANTTTPTASQMLGHSGTPHYDIALLDSGAGFSLLTAKSFEDFNVDGPYPGEPDGFRGTKTIEFGGATGALEAYVDDPLGLYAAGLQHRASTAPLTMVRAAMKGQTNTSLVRLDGDSDLPNVVGLTFASRYATYIRNDMPQIFELDGRTVRAPSIEFNTLGSGGQGIHRRAPMSLNPSASFGGPPTWVYNFDEFDIDNPHENPQYPTLLQGTTGGAFLNVNAKANGQSLGNTQFLFDTGADVTVVSSLSANFLGYDGVPDFTVAVVGSGGTAFDVPGFFVDEFTIFAQLVSNQASANLVLNNVPVIILDVTNPGDPGNVVPGIVGTNLMSGRNVVFDPKPAGGGGPGPSLYISDPITTQKNWATASAVGTWDHGANWNSTGTPEVLNIANVRHVSGGNQTVLVGSDQTVWELNVSGTASETITVELEPGVKFTTYSGVNIEQGGDLHLHNATLDAQFVEILGGSLYGEGFIATGSGPIPGQVENRAGVVSPGNGAGQLEIIGRFANGPDGTLDIELGGLLAGAEYDRILVEGGVTLEGTLAVSLIDLGAGMFTPHTGDIFQIITATEGIGGAFQELLLPDGFNWRINYTESSVELIVGLPGDFNHDRSVDAADYVLWRKNGGTPAEYQAWRANFGATSPGGGSAQAPVPEPAGLLLVLLAACGFAPRVVRITRPARFAASKSCGAPFAS